MMERFRALIEVMATLRGAHGCPWDKAQTRESLRPFLVEETYEVLEALERGDATHLKEELGDLLFQIVFHAQIAAEQGEFTIEDVVAGTVEKMTSRHPHVFGEASAATPAEAIARWETMKDQEDEGRSVLEGVPASMPALLRAHRIQEKVARVGFDWTDVRPVLDKVREELSELEQEMAARAPQERLEAELGDLLFVLVNLARHLSVNPEDALHRAGTRFTARFQAMETSARQTGRVLAQLSPAELDQLWEEAKRQTR